MSRQEITISFSRSRGGRAILHALCLARGKNVRWHFSGIIRELFRRTGRSCETIALLSFFLSLTAAVLPTSSAQAALGLNEAILAAANQSTSTATATVPTLRLLPTAQVDGTGVFLNQIVVASDADPAALQVRVAAPPSFGRLLNLSRDQIIAALQTANPELATAHWAGGDTVRIIRRNRIFGEAEMRDLLAATLQREQVKDKGELELRLARPWTPINVPDEAFTMHILDVPTTGLSQHFIVRFELVAGEERLGPWQAVAQAKIIKGILVASSTTRRGETLEASELTVERRDIIPLREPLDESALRSSGLEFIEAVPAGQPILARSVRPRPIVQRGMMIDGLIHDGPLQITLKVEALADGLAGQMIRVRNPKTKREFYAKVQNEQTVLINL